MASDSMASLIIKNNTKSIFTDIAKVINKYVTLQPNIMGFSVNINAIPKNSAKGMDKHFSQKPNKH